MAFFFGSWYSAQPSEAVEIYGGSTYCTYITFSLYTSRVGHFLFSVSFSMTTKELRGGGQAYVEEGGEVGGGEK